MPVSIISFLKLIMIITEKFWLLSNGGFDFLKGSFRQKCQRICHISSAAWQLKNFSGANAIQQPPITLPHK